MSVTDLAARRWARTDDTKALKPVDAPREAIRAIKAGEVEASHVIVCLGISDDEGLSTDWFQAGDMDGYAQLGLLERVKMAMLMDAAGED